jgi:[acyl-carrier-protein] S-malonyltransferase
VEVRECLFPVYANCSAVPVIRPDQIRTALKRQVCGRVLWVDCVQNAIADAKPDLAVEFGAGNVLAGLMKRINPGLKCMPAGSLENIEKLRM